MFEIRIESGGNIFRIFCCFDRGNLIVLFNAFQKKSHHGIATDKHDIDLVAKRLREAEEIDRSVRTRKR